MLSDSPTKETSAFDLLDVKVGGGPLSSSIAEQLSHKSCYMDQPTSSSHILHFSQVMTSLSSLGDTILIVDWDYSGSGPRG